MRVGTGSWIVAFGGNGGKGAERACIILGGMGWVGGWLVGF